MHDSAGKWIKVCERICRGALWSALLVGVLAITACQGDGDTGEDPETLAQDSGTATLSGEAAETPSGDSGTATPSEEAAEIPSGDSGTAAPSEEAADIPSGDPVKRLPSGEPVGTVDRIAFIDATGELFTIRPDGDDLRSYTSGLQTAAGFAGPVLAQPLDFTTYYTWPTWSPFGTKIAASRVEVSDGDLHISLEIIDVETSRTLTAYTNQVLIEIARGAPHYLYWSPGDRNLAFLASASSGQTLFVLDTFSRKRASLAVGAPLYFQWARDGDSIILHDRLEVNLIKKPFDEGAQNLVTALGDFRAPAFSPDGQQFAYIDVTDAGFGLMVAPISNPEQGINILDVGRRAAFTWSPNGRDLAIADQLDPANAVFERIRLVSAEGGQVRAIGEGPILAFFWSPLGDKLAWVVLDLESRAFDWNVSDSSGGPAKLLIRFQPSNNFFTMLSFFDQYAYSHSPWSPDGTRMVVSGTQENTLGQGNGTTPTQDKVFVLDATGAEAPRSIAAGVLAFWSWN